MKPAAARERVRCRLVTEGDIPAVIDLLGTGFRGRNRAVWVAGLRHMAERSIPGGTPRYGYCLEAGGKLVGIILLIASSRQVNGEPAVFCNVASWYVVPDYRAYAQLLVSMALRSKVTTYTNVSPAPHTWSIVENQGYTRYCSGLFFAAAALCPPQRGAALEALAEGGHHPAHEAMPDYAMLRRHLEMGCKVVVVREDDRLTGFIFQRYRIRSGTIALPGMLVLHAPDRAQLIRLTGNFGRHFMMNGAPFLAMDADGPVGGLRGIYTEARGRKYCKGPIRPALCDLADSEYAIFGV